MIATIFARPLLYGIALAAVLVAVVWAYQAIKDTGVQQERHRVEEANRISEERADESANTFDLCVAAGRDWSRARGVCLPAGDQPALRRD